MKKILIIMICLISTFLIQGCAGFGVYSNAGTTTSGFYYYDAYPFYYNPPVYHFHNDPGGWVHGNYPHHYRHY